MKIRFNILLDENDIAELKAIGKAKGLSVSSIVRMLIKEYIRGQRSSSPG